jgi:hypothetical protein
MSWKTALNAVIVTFGDWSQREDLLIPDAGNTVGKTGLRQRD